eukprot:TRINITY_DN42309_c0_g1_i2.p1 TRINITY_DN42309_c0_g1~~TRINITY_DN42309_c0_g1_i2.p1  ORF type:complete len:333 (+),score=81.27 TRINITY_DN42309_c0_g1_i2:69-1067(+)
MRRSLGRCFNAATGGAASPGGLQLASLPEVAACRHAYEADDFKACLPLTERALDIADKYLKGSLDYVLLSAVAGRCCWRLHLLPAAARHLEDAASAASALEGHADAAVALRRATQRVNAELRPPSADDSLDALAAELQELNRLLREGGRQEVPASLVSVAENSDDPLVWTSLGEAAVMGRVALPADTAQNLLKRVLEEASLPSVPSYAGLRQRALQGLGTLQFKAHKAVTAEGLFRAAKDAWDEDTASAGSVRLAIQKANCGFAYGAFLRQWEGRERQGEAEIQIARDLLHKHGFANICKECDTMPQELAAWTTLILPPMALRATVAAMWAE